jgi:hypothetical protein
MGRNLKLERIPFGPLLRITLSETVTRARRSPA